MCRVCSQRGLNGGASRDCQSGETADGSVELRTPTSVVSVRDSVRRGLRGVVGGNGGVDSGPRDRLDIIGETQTSRVRA